MENGKNPINPINKLDDVMRYGMGLTKREYFAAMAMQGVMTKATKDDSVEEIVMLSINLADELLKQLEK